MSKLLYLAVILAVSLSLVACGAAGPAPLALDTLKNASYELPDIGAVQLTNGQFEHKYGEGATQVNTVSFQTAALGSLDGDKAEDAAVVLAANTGGSGTFVYLVAVRNEGGKPKPVATTLLGDRIKVDSVSIVSGRIVVQMLTFGPNDPLCCPTQRATVSLTLQGDQLVPAGQ